MLNWWFVGRQAVIDVVLGPWTSILSFGKKKVSYDGSHGLIFKFEVIPPAIFGFLVN